MAELIIPGRRLGRLVGMPEGPRNRVFRSVLASWRDALLPAQLYERRDALCTGRVRTCKDHFASLADISCKVFLRNQKLTSRCDVPHTHSIPKSIKLQQKRWIVTLIKELRQVVLGVGEDVNPYLPMRIAYMLRQFRPSQTAFSHLGSGHHTKQYRFSRVSQVSPVIFSLSRCLIGCTRRRFMLLDREVRTHSHSNEGAKSLHPCRGDLPKQSMFVCGNSSTDKKQRKRNDQDDHYWHRPADDAPKVAPRHGSHALMILAEAV